MGFERLSIDCESIENRDEVFKALDLIGGEGVGEHGNLLFIILYEDGEYLTHDRHLDHGNFKKLTYKQFMEKYLNKGGIMNKQLMISIIDAAKKQLNLGNSELSLKLGHHRNYISRVLHQENPSIEQITKVVDKVNALIGEQKLPCGKPLPEFKHTPISDAVMVSKDEYDKLKESNANLFNDLSIKDFQINKFKKELNHKNQVLDKRNAVLENHINRVNDLESQLKTTQQKFVDVVDQKDKEIKKLQNDCNHATNQYQGKRAQVVRLNEKLKKQAIIYLIIIVIISLIGIMGFVS